ncbi:MAG: ABC transporter ATP-binding protein/permease [Turicibacter sp.]|nr:ABC transporter ATP-binding protein/permease [Turicibacter sp.]
MKEIKVLWGWMRGHRLAMGVAMSATVVGIVFSSLIPLVNQAAIDFVIVHNPEAAGDFVSDFLLGIDGLRPQLLAAGILIVILTTLNALTSFIQGRFIAKSAEGFAKGLKDRIFDHIQKLPFMYHKRAETGDLIQRCTSDIETIRNFLTSQMVEMANCLFLFVVIFIFMLRQHVAYALVSVALLPFLLVFSLLFFNKVRAAFKISDESEAAMSTMLQENLSGVRVVRAYNNQEHEIEKFERFNQDFRNTSLKVSRISSVFWSSTDFLCFMQLTLIILFGAYLVMTGEVTLGVLQTFIVYGNMLVWPVRGLSNVLTELGKSTISVKRIQEVMDEEPEHLAEGLKQPIEGHIRFDGVGFHYPDESDGVVLEDVSFEVLKGQTVAIIGRTGSGKSTLMNILLRLYDYTHGAIQIDGMELKQISKKHLRKNIGVVMQELFLYTKTIGQNIKISRKDAKEQEVHEAATMAAVHHVIEDFEEGYDTMVGERGVTLSGGQKQRVGIARALMDKTPILIFDDSLSAVDSKTDSDIREALAKRSKDVTTFIISHRVSTVKEADLIVVLDKGRVVQKGTHESLIGEEGLYKAFWDIQDQKGGAQVG